jgi:hypothetical protein
MPPQGRRYKICSKSVVKESYTVVAFVTSVSAVPNPLPPCCPVAVPLPEDNCSVGPADPPPTTAVGGEPNVTGADGAEPMYWL